MNPPIDIRQIKNTYQDIYIRGETVKCGDRECAWRYVPIKGLLLRLDKPCRILDFGSGSGYFGHRLAYEFPNCKVTMIDPDPLLSKISKLNSLPNTEIINRKINADDLNSLGKFDIIIAYSVLHHMDDWNKYLYIILKNSDFALIETPQHDEHIHTYRRTTANQIHHVISSLPNTTIVCFTPPRRATAKIDFTGAKPRPTYLITNKPLPPAKPINLEVTSGTKSASRTTKFWETTDWKPLNFTPYQGSLNLDGEEAPVIATWSNKVFLNVKWGQKKYENWKWYEWLIVWKVKLNGYKVYAKVGEKPDIEILSQIKLRDKLEVRDGDIVKVEPDQ